MDDTDELLNRLRRFVDATDHDADDLNDCLQSARAYLKAAIGSGFDALAAPIRNDVVVAVAADLWGQRDARNGVMNVGDPDTLQSFRVSTDPLRAAWPKLRAAGILAGKGIA